MHPLRTLPALLTVLASLAPALASAHTFTPISDAALADRATLIVRARIADRTAILLRGAPYTDYRLERLENIKGVATTRLLLRTPGGTLPDGSHVLSTASPSFRPGDEVLLFLDDGETGVHRVIEGRLGAFRIDGNGPDAIARRQLAATSSPGDPDGRRWLGPRRAAGFIAWLRDRARGRARPADYFLPEPAVQAVTAPFLLLQVQGRAARWADTKLEFRGFGALPGSPDGGLAAAVAGAKAWDDASGLSLTILPDGGSASIAVQDGINGILYADPADEIAGSFDCASGGTLGETRIRIQLLPQEVEGETFFTLLETDVVLQDGIECWLDRSPGGAEELIGHEIGHAVGIDHSEVFQALMFASAHGDGRGARLDEDDIAALRALKYGEPDLEDPGSDELPSLRKPRALRPRGGGNGLPLALRFRTRDDGTPYGGPVLYYEIEITRRGEEDPAVTRTLRFGRDLEDGCAASRAVCDVTLDARAVTSMLEPGERYVWRLRAGQGFPGRTHDVGPWSNRRKFRVRS